MVNEIASPTARNDGVWSARNDGAFIINNL